MKEYTIMTDSCCDLPSEYIENNHISYIPLTCNVEGKEYIDNLDKVFLINSFMKL